MKHSGITVRRKSLYVEGMDEQRVIPYLVEGNGIEWGETARDRIVEIKQEGGIERLLDPERVRTRLANPNLSHIGFIVDADEDATAVYRAAHGACRHSFPTLPATPPPEGAIAEHDGRTLGIWVMPDNQSRGMLETFLAFLVDDTDPLWAHAQAARTHGRTPSASARR